MSPSALIAEDEELPRRDLQALLAELWPQLRVVALATNGEQALEALAEHAPQVAFLDIRMPGPSGLDVARAASGRCHVVFTTAYDQYAVDAFAAQAVDYVLKPIKRERLAETVERLQARLALRPAATPADLTPLLEQIERQLRPPAAQRLRFISASVGETVKLFAVDEVLYFQSDEKYTRVVTADDEALIRKTLKELLAELDPQEFWQVHRGTVVKVGAIARAARDSLGRIQLTLKARADKLAVSQAYAWRFRGM